MARSAVILIAGIAAVLLVFFVSFPEYSNGNRLLTRASVSNSEIIISNFQAGHKFIKQTSAGTQADDPSDFALGQQSLRLETAGDGMAVFTRKSNISPTIDFDNKLMKVWIKVSNSSRINELRITVTGDSFQTYKNYWIQGGTNNTSASYLRNNEWNQITLSLSQTTSFGSPSLSQINTVQLRVQDKANGPVTVWINGLSLAAKNSRGIVSFTFDDGYDSVYLKARPVLDKYHYSATSFVVTGKIGNPGRMTMDQLKKLQDLNGWDISSHTIDHADLTLLSATDIDNELATSKQFLIDNGLRKGADHFAYPYGSFDNDVLDQLVQKYYKTARTTKGTVETLPPGDPYRLRVLIVTNSTTPNTVLTRVQNAMLHGDWLILVFHRIVDSNADVDTNYLKSNFEAIVNGIETNGIDVMTVSEVYDARYR